MNFRLSRLEDIKSIMEIINKGKEKLNKENIEQWQDGYPNEESIINDIKNTYSYVLVEENIIIGTVAISFDGESTYNKIYNGSWITTNEPYAVMHRVAVDINSKIKGKGRLLIENTEKLCKDKNINSIKIDTHEQNISMQNLLINNGFKYCGVIYLENGEKRLAYEKNINNIIETNYYE